VPPPAAPATGAPGSAPAATSDEILRSLALQALVYADTPAERMVFINGRKYREGDVVQPDLVLQQITETGAVLTYRGQLLLLRDPSSR